MSFLSNLMDRAQSFLGTEKKATQTQAVEADRLDHGFWKDIRAQVRPIDRLVTDLKRGHDHVEEFMEDLFNAAYKADPTYRDTAEMASSHLPNHTMVNEIAQSQQFQQLRAGTKGDEYGSALAMVSMEQAIRETQTAMKEAQARADEAQEAQDAAEKAAQEAGEACQGIPGLDPNAEGPQLDPNAPPSPGQQAAQQAIENAIACGQQAGNARSQAQEISQEAATSLKASFKAAAEKAQQDLDKENEMMSAFGVEDGQLKRMSFDERTALAKRLGSNRLAKFYKLLGQFKMIQQSESRKKVMHAADEVVGVKLGDNLQRIIPAEMLNLATPELETDFWLRYANHELLEYDLRGTEKLGQGPVIVICDESNSMQHGQLAGGSCEAWSKALALSMCDQARQKGRDFHYIGFSSSKQQWLKSFPGGKTTIDGVIEMTEHFFDGGTYYEAPLRQALRLIEDSYDQFNKPRPDIVFITDDEYGSMDEDFMSEWHRVKDKTSVRCFGIALGCGFSGALKQVSDNVRSLQDVTDSDPRVMADLFRVV